MYRNPAIRGAPGRGRNRTAGRGSLIRGALVLALVAPAMPVPGRALDTFHQSGAVLINVTQQDLNLIVRSLVRANGGPDLEGSRDRSSKGISDLHYRARLTEPVLTLGDSGRGRLSVGIEDGGIEIGRIERKMGDRTAYCEDLGAVVKRPIDVDLDFELRIESGDLHVVPESLELSKPKASFKLIKPARCENMPLPTWLAWWIGKGKIKDKLAKLDDALLESARKSAAGLNGRDGFLRKRWAHEAEDGGGHFITLQPEWLSTSPGALTVSMATESSQAPSGPPGTTDWAEALAGRSFVGVSESFLKSYLRFAVSDLAETRRKPSGDYRRLFKSSSIYALIPGLREVESKDDLSISFALRSQPDIQIRSVTAGEIGIDPRLERAAAERPDESRAVIRVVLSDLEMKLWSSSEASAEPEPIGTLVVDSGVVGVVPFLNTIGGVSFALVENEWKLSSSGIDFNEELFAATLQELVFGEVFETHYEPVWTDALTVGDTRFGPRYFRSIGGYLVVELGS